MMSYIDNYTQTKQPQQLNCCSQYSLRSLFEVNTTMSHIGAVDYD